MSALVSDQVNGWDSPRRPKLSATRVSAMSAKKQMVSAPKHTDVNHAFVSLTARAALSQPPLTL